MNDGILYRLVKADQRVEVGDPLGHVTDFFGNRLVELRAPRRGLVLSVFGTPPVKRGDTVVVIAHEQ